MTPAQREILLQVCRRHKVTIESLVSPSRVPRIAHPRQEAMYLMRETGKWSLPQIGRAVNRTHWTVMHGIRAHSKRLGIAGMTGRAAA